MYVVCRAAAFAGVMLWCSFGGDWSGGVRLPPMSLDTDLASSVKASDNLFLGRRRRPYIVFRNRFLYGFMFVYIYIYIYVCMYIYICQDGGAVGFVDFTKLLFALSSLAQSLKRVRSIPEHFFVILSQRKACAERFREETAEKRTGPITRWPLRRLLFTRLEIVFVTISPFTKRTKGAQKVFQEG